MLGGEARQGGGTEGFQFGDRGGRSGEALGSSPVSRRPPDVGLLGEEQAGADGAEAVALATQHDADVVLMDLRMPGMPCARPTRPCGQAARLPPSWCSPPTPTTTPSSGRAPTRRHHGGRGCRSVRRQHPSRPGAGAHGPRPSSSRESGRRSCRPSLTADCRLDVSLTQGLADHPSVSQIIDDRRRSADRIGKKRPRRPRRREARGPAPPHSAVDEEHGSRRFAGSLPCPPQMHHLVRLSEAGRESLKWTVQPDRDLLPVRRGSVFVVASHVDAERI